MDACSENCMPLFMQDKGACNQRAAISTAYNGQLCSSSHVQHLCTAVQMVSPLIHSMQIAVGRPVKPAGMFCSITELYYITTM